MSDYVNMREFYQDEQKNVADDFFDGHAVAVMSLGEFIELLVDGGPTDVVVAQITNKDKDISAHPDGYVQEMKIALVPNGRVLEYLKDHKADLINRVLMAAMDAGKIR